jgi:hypothetical protein
LLQDFGCLLSFPPLVWIGADEPNAALARSVPIDKGSISCGDASKEERMMSRSSSDRSIWCVLLPCIFPTRDIGKRLITISIMPSGAVWRISPRGLKFRESASYEVG